MSNVKTAARCFKPKENSFSFAVPFSSLTSFSLFYFIVLAVLSANYTLINPVSSKQQAASHTLACLPRTKQQMAS